MFYKAGSLVLVCVLIFCIFTVSACNHQEKATNGHEDQIIESGSPQVEPSNEGTPIEIDITSPLVIHLWEGPVEYDIDYTKNPIRVDGIVSHPEATVKVNGQTVNVADDGSFSHELQLDSGSDDTITKITAKATLGTETDSWIMAVGVAPDGRILRVPGMGSGAHIYEPLIRHQETVDVEVGEVKTLDVTLESGKQTHPYYPSEFYYDIENPFVSQGLEVTIEPERFIAYANTTYHSTLTIKTTNEINPGEYEIKLHHHGAMVGFTHIDINVVR